jgi:hypothetical protein
MQLNVRELVVLFALGAAFCVAFLFEPEWDLTEAHMLCTGEPVRVFDSMAACSAELRPGCPCMRPDNPWAYIFWLVMLPLVGVTAALSLRSRWLPAAAMLSVVLAAAGAGALLLLSHRESFDEEAWAVGQVVVAAYIVFILCIFGLGRVVRHWILTRRSATHD